MGYMNDMRRDILRGFISGLIVPPVLFLFIWLIFKLSYDVNIPYDVQSSLLLFGMGVNFIMSLRAFNRRKEFIGRGWILSIMPYAIFWVIKFLSE